MVRGQRPRQRLLGVVLGLHLVAGEVDAEGEEQITVTTGEALERVDIAGPEVPSDLWVRVRIHLVVVHAATVPQAP